MLGTTDVNIKFTIIKMQSNLGNYQCPMVLLAQEGLISKNARESKSGDLDKHSLETIKVEIKKSQKFGVWMFILLDTVSSFL